MQASKETALLANVKIQKSVGRTGSTPGDFKSPKGLAVEPFSQNIYIAEMLNDRVQVFSPSLEFLFQFPNAGGAGLSFPWGVCIQGHLVFVTETASLYFLNQAKHGFSIYTLEGNLVSRVLRNVLKCEEEKLNIPRGIVLDDERNAFIADYQNNRVVLYTTGLPTVTTVIREIKHPIDVKIFEKSLFVLTDAGLLIKRNLQSHETTTVIESEIFWGNSKPHFFQIKSERFYITVSASHKIYELSLEGDILSHTSNLEFRHIAGIGFNRNSQIVIICEKEPGRLNILS